jgi:hypothetical protein
MLGSSHAVRGWWRYSKLTVIPFGPNAVLTFCLWLVALANWRPVTVALALVVTTVLLGQLVYGAVHAERARRYGCW